LDILKYAHALTVYMLHAEPKGPLCVCVSVSLFPSAPTSNFENDSQTQLNLNSVSACGLWLSGKHFRSRDHITKHPKASDFFQSVAIYCRFGPFLWAICWAFWLDYSVHKLL